MRPPPRPLRAARLAALVVLLAGCASDGPTAEQLQSQLEIHTESAQTYLAMGELDRAEDQALRGLEIDPDSEVLRIVRGYVLIKRGRPEDVLRAERVFREIAGSDDYRAPLGLGEALERKGVAFAEAAQDVRSGRRLTEAPDPEKRADEHLARAQAAWKESLEWYLRALTLRPEDPDGTSGMARVHGLMGNREASLEWTVKVIDSTERDLAFWKEKLARPALSTDEERRFRNLVSQIEGRQEAAHLTASTLLFDLGRYGEARAHLDRALELDPRRAEIYSRRAELHQRLEQPAEALADIDTYLRLSTREFSHPDVQRAWALRTECEKALRRASANE